MARPYCSSTLRRLYFPYTFFRHVLQDTGDSTLLKVPGAGGSGPDSQALCLIAHFLSLSGKTVVSAPPGPFSDAQGSAAAAEASVYAGAWP